MNIGKLLELILATNLLKQLQPNRGKDDVVDESITQYIIFADEKIDESKFKQQIEKRGGRLIKKLNLVNGYVCQFQEDRDTVNLQSISEIERVDEDVVLKVSSSEDRIPWGLQATSALEAWEFFRKVKVGVIDTGVDLDHYDLMPVHNGINVINSRRLPYDFHGHGTHVSGTIGGRKNGRGVLGILPDVELYPIKAFDRRGNGRLSSIVEGIEWSIDNDIQILNMSFGTTEDNSTLKDAIAKAYEAGITMIAAAGNNSNNKIDFPAKYPEVIAVGAIDKSKEVADFSNYGEELDILAPGVNILSTWRNNRLRTLDGTSMATAHVTGIVALMLSVFKGLTPKEIKKLLLEGASPLSSVAKEKQGAGLVDVLKTMQLAQKIVNKRD